MLKGTKWQIATQPLQMMMITDNFKTFLYAASCLLKMIPSLAGHIILCSWFILTSPSSISVLCGSLLGSNYPERFLTGPSQESDQNQLRILNLRGIHVVNVPTGSFRSEA
jgi:hypothetical protein